MFERETKREKILEARHREMRLKERARSEGQDAEAEEIPEESPQEALDRAQKEFFEVIEAELQRRARAEARHLDGKVPGAAQTCSCRGLRNPRGSPPPGCPVPWDGEWGNRAGDVGQPLPFRLKSGQERRRWCRARRASCPSMRKRARKRMPPR